MTTTIVPTWVNEASALIAPRVLARNSVYRTTLDLTAKAGAMLVFCVGRAHTTGITGNITLRIRRMQLNSVRSVPASYAEYVGGTTTGATVVAVQNTTVASAVTAIDMTATPTGFGTTAANLLFWGHTQPSGLTAGATFAGEWVKGIAAWNSTQTTAKTAVWVDAPTALARVASEVCTNLAEIYGPVFLPGGAVYEIIFDYGSATAGEVLGIAAYYGTYTCDTAT